MAAAPVRSAGPDSAAVSPLRRLTIAPPDGPLPDDADQRTERLTALAIAALGSRERARRWLQRPRREFGGAAPLEMVETPAAARQVETLLRQLLADRAEGED